MTAAAGEAGAPEAGAAGAPPDAPADGHPVRPAPAPEPRGRRLAWLLFGLAGVLFVYHLIADRVTPYSPYGYIRAYLVRIAPEVSGAVTEVGVTDNSRAAEGSLLFRIDPQDYEIAVSAAEAQLAQAGQAIGSSTEEVSAAQAALAQAQADLQNQQEQSSRILEMVAEGVYAAARGDSAAAALDAAEARVDQAEANLRRAREALGPEGEDNPLLQAALADLSKARLALIRTVVTAPADGAVTGLQLAPGEMVQAGHAVMSFIDLSDIWIVSYLTENNLGLLEAGDPVEIAFDVRPGEIYSGRIVSLGFGVKVDDTTAGGDLPSGTPGPSVTSSDLRFPVRIAFEGDYPKGLRFGSRAQVIAYPADNGIMNGLGWLRIRLASLWNYVD